MYLGLVTNRDDMVKYNCSVTVMRRWSGLPWRFFFPFLGNYQKKKKKKGYYLASQTKKRKLSDKTSVKMIRFKILGKNTHFHMYEYMGVSTCVHTYAELYLD